MLRKTPNQLNEQTDCHLAPPRALPLAPPYGAQKGEWPKAEGVVEETETLAEAVVAGLAMLLCIVEIVLILLLLEA